MKETNELETLLRSLAPRKPSFTIKQRLFSAASAGMEVPRSEPCGNQPETPPFRLAWLAPATMALMLLCVLFNQRNPFPAAPGASGPMIAVALSNQSGASWLPGSFASEQNNIPAETFEVTNGSFRHSGYRTD